LTIINEKIHVSDVCANISGKLEVS